MPPKMQSYENNELPNSMDEMLLLEANHYSSPNRNPSMGNFTVLTNYFEKEKLDGGSDVLVCNVWGHEEVDDHGYYSFNLAMEFKEAAQEDWDVKKLYSEFNQLDVDIR